MRLVELALPELRPVRLDPANSALVIVDMQDEYLAKGPDGRPGTAMGERAVASLVGLVARVRAAGAPIIYVQSIRSPASSEFTVFGRQPWLLEDGPTIEIYAPLRPEPGDVIVRKRTTDCFVHTRMEEVLADLGLTPGRSTVAVAGTATDVCVACAVIGFSVRGYDVAALEDCMFTGMPEWHALGFAHFAGPPYAHNVTPTRSDLIDLGRAPQPSTAGGLRIEAPPRTSGPH